MCCILLVGVKHSGKSTIAKAFDGNRYAIYDLDDMMLRESSAHQKISELYRDIGAVRFHALECACLRKALHEYVASNRKAIIDCGGGICTYRPSRRIIARCRAQRYPLTRGKKMHIVHVSATADETMARMTHTHPPAFLVGCRNPQKTWRKIAARRTRAYAALSSIEIDSTCITPLIGNSEAIREYLHTALDTNAHHSVDSGHSVARSSSGGADAR